MKTRSSSSLISNRVRSGSAKLLHTPVNYAVASVGKQHNRGQGWIGSVTSKSKCLHVSNSPHHVDLGSIGPLQYCMHAESTVAKDHFEVFTVFMHSLGNPLVRLNVDPHQNGILGCLDRGKLAACSLHLELKLGQA